MTLQLLTGAVDWSLLFERITQPDNDMLRALWATVYISVLAEIMGVLLGLAATFMRRSRFLLARAVSGAYVLVFRGTPVIVQIFFIYFGANLVFGVTIFPREVTLGPLSVDGAIFAGIVALGLNEGAYMREIMRACIDAVDPGQMTAARSLGMTRRQGMRRIVLPQAARIFVPPLSNQFNYMMKVSSLLAFIGVYELFADAQAGYSTTFQPVEYFGAVGFWYLVLSGIWAVVTRQMERALSRNEREAPTGDAKSPMRMLAKMTGTSA